jgi:molecular chaperone GrpE (heat shock protein)
MNGDSTARLQEAVDRLQRSFDEKIRYDEVRERQVAELHEEVQGHRRGLYRQILEPVLTDLIGLHDEITKMAKDEADSGNASFLLSSIEEILSRYGVSRFTCDGDQVDRGRQKVIDVLATGNEELDRLVAQRIRPGFELDGKTLRPEWVVAYRYAADAVPAGAQSAGSG